MQVVAFRGFRVHPTNRKDSDPLIDKAYQAKSGNPSTRKFLNPKPPKLPKSPLRPVFRQLIGVGLAREASSARRDGSRRWLGGGR